MTDKLDSTQKVLADCRRKADDLRAVIAAYGFTEHSEQRKKLEMQAREWDVMADRIESLMNAEPSDRSKRAWEKFQSLLNDDDPAKEKPPQPSEDCAALREALEEADRRAGAAERLRAQDQESIQARKRWLKKAKAEAGYDDSVSFDVVWKDALAAMKELERYKAAFLVKPVSDWHDDEGDALFFNIHVGEPPEVTSPLSDDFRDDYYTHYCPLPPVFTDPIVYEQVLKAAKGEWVITTYRRQYCRHIDK